jgi:pimeloyl-ACP methyl ester carboxylesterase
VKRLLLIGFVLLLVAVLALPWWRDEERGPLDARARSAAPGRFVNLAHGAVHVQQSGRPDAPAVLLVPGFSVPSYVWEPLDAQLAEAGFRVVRFDLYGRGWSARPDVVYDRELFAIQLRELMDALEIERAHVVGLSMGGAIAAHFAVREPQRVDRLALIAPFTRARDIAPLQHPLLGEWALRAYVLPRIAAGQTSDFVHPERHPDWAARFRPQMRYDGFGRAILSTLRHVMTRDSLPDFAAVGRQSRQVLVVWGRRDSVVPFAHSQDVLAAIPQARLIEVDDAGHLPHVEHPELVGPPLIEFLGDGGRARPLTAAPATLVGMSAPR